jgi:hypothetical protein
MRRLAAQSAPWAASTTPARARAFGSLDEDFVRLTAYDTVPTDDERGDACHADLCGFLSYRIDALEVTFRTHRLQVGLGLQSGADRDFSQVVPVFQVLSCPPMGVHGGVTKHREFSLRAGILSDRQGAPGVGPMVGQL